MSNTRESNKLHKLSALLTPVTRTAINSKFSAYITIDATQTPGYLDTGIFEVVDICLGLIFDIHYLLWYLVPFLFQRIPKHCWPRNWNKKKRENICFLVYLRVAHRDSDIKNKNTLTEDDQYTRCWLTVDRRDQGISSLCADIFLPEYPVAAPRKLHLYFLNYKRLLFKSSNFPAVCFFFVL